MAGPPRIQTEVHAAFQIVALANRISSSASRAYLRSYGVGVMEWRVLALLALRPGVSANEISQISGVDKAAVSRSVHALVRRGRVLARTDQADSRRVRLTLTPEGQALHDRMILASLEREGLLLDGLSGEERDALFTLLGKLAANLPRLEAHEPGG